MKTLWAKMSNLFILSFLLPVVYGCKGGGDSAGAYLGSLLGGGGGSASGIGSGNGGGDLASVVNPEPATLALLGGGLVAVGYLRHRSNKKKR